MTDKLQVVRQSILDGDLDECRSSIQQAIDGGMSADSILKQGLIPAMTEVGRLFEEGEYFVPEMLIAARAMQGGLELLKPLLVEEDVQPLGKVVIGTVKGDLHDIGKNLVSMMMEGAGFEIVDLGTDVSPEAFVEAVRTNDANIVAMSALLTTTMTNMKNVIQALKTAGIREKVKIMIGGAPVTEAFAKTIEADGYAADASQAAKLAQSYVA